jgi:hypothetical protein
MLMTEAPQEAPEGVREEPRYERTVERVYRNDRIEVTWGASVLHPRRGVPTRASPGGRPLAAPLDRRRQRLAR